VFLGAATGTDQSGAAKHDSSARARRHEQSPAWPSTHQGGI
jgi:hypothetical protein